MRFTRFLIRRLSVLFSGPPQASGFSARPKYQEAINFLDDVFIRLRRLAISKDEEYGAGVQWLPIHKMSDRVGWQLDRAEYEELVKRLDSIVPFLNAGGPDIVDLVKVFVAKQDDIAVDDTGSVVGAGDAAALAKLDWRGWARATGTRKTAVANVILKSHVDFEFGPHPHHDTIDTVDTVNTTPTVNGKPMHRYFQRFRDLHAVAYPLKLTDRLARYTFEARCRGGGLSGQAGALRLAIAKALVKAEPPLRQLVSQQGLLTRDPRAVERKKPGQEKARRKFAWVKR